MKTINRISQANPCKYKWCIYSEELYIWAVTSSLTKDVLLNKPTSLKLGMYFKGISTFMGHLMPNLGLYIL